MQPARPGSHQSLLRCRLVLHLQIQPGSIFISLPGNLLLQVRLFLSHAPSCSSRPPPVTPSPLKPRPLEGASQKAPICLFSCFTAERAVYKACQCHLKPPQGGHHTSSVSPIIYPRTSLSTLLVVHSAHVQGTRITIRVYGCPRLPCSLLKPLRLTEREMSKLHRTRVPLTMAGLALPPLWVPRTLHAHYSSP